MNLKDKVRKIGGDYTFEGVIVSVFEKLSGKIRFVVEDDRGALHLYSEKNLELIVDEYEQASPKEIAAKIIRELAPLNSAINFFDRDKWETAFAAAIKAERERIRP